MINRQKYLYLLLIASLLGVYAATIFPGNFVVPKDLSWQSIIGKFHYGTNIKDYVRNILLFIPLGVGLGGIITTKKYRPWQVVLLSFLIAVILSGNIELTQILLPSRTSSLSDIACNSLGGILGASFYSGRQEIVNLITAIFTNNYSLINLNLLVAIIISYCSALTLSSWLLLSNVNLSNWDDNYYLAIGNEIDRDITWNGYVTSLYFCDRSLEQQDVGLALKHTHSFFSALSSLVASYIFLENQPYYQDSTKQLPNLSWKIDPELTKKPDNPVKSDLNQDSRAMRDLDYLIHHEKKVYVDHFNNLISQSSPTILNQRIKKSNEFTLSLIIASDQFEQIGPARILALGKNLDNRNLMLGQENNNFTFSLRTPISGDKAEQPEFIIPDLFGDRELHQILITYAQRKITIYVDRIDNQYTFEFHPSSVYQLFLPWHIWRWQVNLQNFNLLGRKLAFFVITLLPLAILLKTLISYLTNLTKSKMLD